MLPSSPHSQDGAQTSTPAAKRAADSNALLTSIAAATQVLDDAEQIMSVTACLMAEHLRVQRCAYAAVEDERVFVITGDYTRGRSITLPSGVST